MKPPLTNKVIFSIVLLLLILVLFISRNNKIKKVQEKFSNEYPSVKLESHFNGIVTGILDDDTTMFRKNPYEAAIIIDDTIKVSITADKEMTQGFMLDDIIALGEIVRKVQGSDEVSIYKLQNLDTLKYNFKLLDDLLYPLKKDK